VNLAIRFLHRLEDSLLVFLLSALIVLASTQIVLRNLFDSGLVWVDPLLRVMVLWLGMIGAAVAAREHKHIQIDVLTRLLSSKILVPVQVLVDLFSAFVCLTIAWYGLTWIQYDYADQIKSFIGVSAWMLEIIVPITFSIIGARYLGHSLQGLLQYFRPNLKQDSTE